MAEWFNIVSWLFLYIREIENLKLKKRSSLHFVNCTISAFRNEWSLEKARDFITIETAIMLNKGVCVWNFLCEICCYQIDTTTLECCFMLTLSRLFEIISQCFPNKIEQRNSLGNEGAILNLGLGIVL